MSRLDGPTRLGVLCFLAYVAVAWAVRFDTPNGPRNASIVYPFETFSMYATLTAPVVSRLLVRDETGALARVEDFASFACAADPVLAGGPCDPPRGARVTYLDRDAVRYIHNHPGGGDERVELVQRTWELPRGRPLGSPRDCVLTTCTVSR
ncbi:MAG TPA: hypothetical protein VIK91_25080 [Nannocystis sp.]